MKGPKAPKLVSVAISTTITIIFWIFFTLYQVLTGKPTPSVEPKLLEPIDAELNISALQGLQGKVFFDEGSVDFKANIPDTILPSVTAIPTPVPTATVPVSELTEPVAE